MGWTDPVWESIAAASPFLKGNITLVECCSSKVKEKEQRCLGGLASPPQRVLPGAWGSRAAWECSQAEWAAGRSQASLGVSVGVCLSMGEARKRIWGGGGFNKGWEKVLGRRWWRHKIQPGQERVCRKQKCWSWSKKHTLETSIKPAVLCNRDESGLKPIFNKTTRDAVSSLTRKLFGCVMIKCSSTHFDISECACLGCGRAELFVFPGLSLKSGKMFFALS